MGDAVLLRRMIAEGDAGDEKSLESALEYFILVAEVLFAGGDDVDELVQDEADVHGEDGAALEVDSDEEDEGGNTAEENTLVNFEVDIEEHDIELGNDQNGADEEIDLALEAELRFLVFVLETLAFEFKEVVSKYLKFLVVFIEVGQIILFFFVWI